MKHARIEFGEAVDRAAAAHDMLYKRDFSPQMTCLEMIVPDALSAGAHQ